MKRRIACTATAVGICLLMSAAPANPALEALIQETQRTEGAVHPYDALFPPRTRVVESDLTASPARIVFSPELGLRTWQRADADRLLATLQQTLNLSAPPRISVRYSGYDATLEDLTTTPDTIARRAAARTVAPPRLAHPVVQRASSPVPPAEAGLFGNHLVIAPSHGWTWHKEDRWQFQRCRLHTTIEDLFTASYSNQFVIPMLENAGAVVFSARERDSNPEEVVVDQPSAFAGGAPDPGWTIVPGGGWSGTRPEALAEAEEPFTQGQTARALAGSPNSITYVPTIPRADAYAVYASWSMSPENSSSVPYIIRHLGGETTVRVNQQAAGNTWVFLGFYEFGMGADEARGSVTVDARNAERRPDGAATYVSADAVRFGGGMGNTAPAGLVSGEPRYAEGARYWLQYAGAPSRLFLPDIQNPGHFGIDYIRDYVSRSEWPNYLLGNPSGPNYDRTTAGLNVPIDLYLSFHTDAGVNHDGIIGTHMIYSATGNERDLTYPDGRSRWLNRDLAALIDQELVRTARENYAPTWQRRTVHNRQLAETQRPNVPAALIEMLSHQNLNDMKYGLDPRFKFDMSRAIYKALVCFIAATEGREPVIQPLPPTHLGVRHTGNGTFEVSWREQPDPLEPTAVADGYVLYRSTDGRAFDNGTLVASTSTRVTFPDNTATYVRVTAYNAGGESFPSRVAGGRWSANARTTLLIVDGFDRVSGPAVVEQGRYAGFRRDIDPGVAWGWNAGLVGDVYNFDRQSDWENDLFQPGHGASRADWESRREPGNTFNHIATWGAALADTGLAFDSVLNDAFDAGWAREQQWPAIVWIAGRQRTTPPPTGFNRHGMAERMTTEFEVLPAPSRQRLASHVQTGGKVILSGAHVIEDLVEGPLANDTSRAFARTVLGVGSFESGATRTNTITASAGVAELAALPFTLFGTAMDHRIAPGEVVLGVPSSESLAAANDAMRPVLAYADTNLAAALAGERVFVAGLPLETLTPARERHAAIRGVLALMKVE